MTVAEILIDKIAKDVWLEIVVAGLPGLRLVGGNDRRSLIEEERDVALHPDRVAEIVARRECNGSAACRSCCFNGPVHSCRIEGPAVSLRAVLADVVGRCCCSYPERSNEREASGANRAKRSSSKETAPVESAVARELSQLKVPLVLGFVSRSIPLETRPYTDDTRVARRSKTQIESHEIISLLGKGGWGRFTVRETPT